MPVSLDKSFNFNKGHRRAVIILSVLVLGLILYRYYLRITPENNFNNKGAIVQVESFIAAQDSITKSGHTKKKKTFRRNKVIVKLHPFNPNVMSTDGLLEIGLSRKQANTIQNYLLAGGEFVYKEDLKKIYCISDEDYYRLEPYILLDERPTNYKETKPEDEVIVTIELNSAQAEDLLSVRGIGPYIAKNIIKYRDKLGGYYSISQLREVYGIDSAKYDGISYYFEINTDSVRRTDLNTTNYYKLQQHPYITKNIAFEISNHAKYEMPFKAVEELKELNTINDSVYQKIYHYFVVY